MYVTNRDYRERDKGETRSHLCLHALNKTGYHNLVRLASEAFINGFYYKPRIDRSLLEKYHEGLHCSAACLAGEVSRQIAEGRMDEAEKIVADQPEYLARLQTLRREMWQPLLRAAERFSGEEIEL